MDGTDPRKGGRRGIRARAPHSTGCRPGVGGPPPDRQDGTGSTPRLLAAFTTLFTPATFSPAVSVCLHCGELATDGALFCTKCGYTLPQVDAAVGITGSPAAGAPLGTSSPPASPASPAAPSAGIPVAYPLGGYATLAPPTAGAVGPIAPPPAGKYCIRCRTIISRAAVFCPVCQQPQF
jgi:RNA polymerase subunit RPABC4/transcription elongation factor Spt4